jgi:mycothione reductase
LLPEEVQTLHTERAGIKTDENGWIVVNEYLETSQPNIWVFGDANGVYPFKHKLNYEVALERIMQMTRAFARVK